MRALPERKRAGQSRHITVVHHDNRHLPLLLDAFEHTGGLRKALLWHGPQQRGDRGLLLSASRTKQTFKPVQLRLASSLKTVASLRIVR